MISPQGYTYGEDPKADNPFWSDDEIVEQLTASATVDNTVGTPSVEVSKTGYNFNFDFHNLKGETGDQGPQGEPGSDANIDKAVTDISVTNTDGVYVISKTMGDGTTSDVGSIEVPETDNLLAEVTDSVVEDTTNNYDFHTIKETENNGTQNDVGKFYIARNQITGINSDGAYTYVDQSGNMSAGQLPKLSVLHTVGPFSFEDQAVNNWANGLVTPALNGMVLSFSTSGTSYSISGSAEKTYDESSTEAKLTSAFITIGEIDQINGTNFTDMSLKAFEPVADLTDPLVLISDMSSDYSGSKKIRLGANGKFAGQGNDISGLGQSLMYFDLSFNMSYVASTRTLTLTPSYLEYAMPGYVSLIYDISFTGVLE